MRKILLILLFYVILSPFKLMAQCDLLKKVPEIKYSGVAPFPWAINGNTNDWQMILGAQNGSNGFPYNPSYTSAFNYSRDPISGFSDLDNPSPSSDIRLTAFTYDDYNVYFYFRRLANSNSPNSFFYFCDINADGFMNAGEPVFGGRFNGHNFIELSLNRFVPNINDDYISGKGNYMYSPNSGYYVDGYTIKGSVQKIFNSNAIPTSSSLSPNEVFSAEVTENGYGVEFAVPWKYFKNWITQSSPLLPGYIFTYHIASQKGASPGYQPQLVEDNVGNCCGKLLISNHPAFIITNTNITPIVSGISYRMNVTLQNTKNVEEIIQFLSVDFKNILLNNGSSFSPEDFLVKVNGINFDYAFGSYMYQPISYSMLGSPFFVQVNPFSSVIFTVEITLPINHSISQLSVDLNFSDAELNSIPIYCFLGTGGGKGINPVGFDIFSEVQFRNNQKENKEKKAEKPQTKFRVYPNPSSGSITIELPVDVMNGELRLYDISGKTIIQRSNLTNSVVKLENLRPGFYLLKVISKDSGNEYIDKIIVQ